MHGSAVHRGGGAVVADHLRQFQTDYDASRESFRQLADRRGYALEAHSIAATGPDGGGLTIDVAIAGNPGAGSALVVSSGLHGVEGYFGAAVQRAWMECSNGPSRGLRVVLVHALNPYGFAHIRRSNEHNVDLNRSFIASPGRETPAAYHRIASFLNPPTPPRRTSFFNARAVWLMIRHGPNRIRQAAVGGQYEYPLGLFYGGDGRTATRDLLEASLASWLGSAQRVVHLDLHTGLGRWGHGMLLTSTGDRSPEASTLRSVFGPDLVRTPGPRSGYQASGDLGEYTARFASDRGLLYLYGCAEFGTHSGLAVLRALRDENRAHHWCEPSDPRCLAAKRRLLEAFCPADPRWRNASAERAIRIVETARRWLEESGATSCGRS